MEDYPPILGIDLGTTYSCASIFKNNNYIIIPNELGERITPSFVSFFEDNERLIGTLAKERILKKQTIVFNSKRFIGRSYKDKEIQSDLKYLPFNLIEDKGRDRVKIKLEGLGTLLRDEYHPEEISAMILKKIKEDAEFYLKRDLKEVVITTPAYFNQKQRISTKQAAEIAGLKVRRIINEPTAASIAYAFLEKEKLGSKNLILDFGGGTLDLTLLSFSKNEKIYCKILCSSGDTHLGGQDIDNIICNNILNEYKCQISSYLHKNPKFDFNPAKIRLLKACEKGKILLSSENEALIFVDSILPTLNIKYTLKRKDLEKILTKFFNERIKPCISFFLKKCNLTETQIEKIIFVGGSSKIPILKDFIQNIFKESKILSSINPEEVVAIGAGIIAAQLNGDQNLKDLNLFDVTSLSLGTNIQGNLMNIIIPKSTPYPVKKKQIYSTITDNQDTISNKVYEGESEKLVENDLLGDFKITGLTKRKAGETKIELEFELTSNLILKVKAKELNRNDNKTNEKKDKVKLEEPKGFFKIDEINKMKDSIKNEKENEWQDIYKKKYQENLIKLKENLYKSNDKYMEQLKILEYLEEFLSHFDQKKFDNQTLYYKVYTLYVVFFFIEINKLINFKKNIDFNEISKIVIDYKLEQKIEDIKFKINDIIWEILDICNSNKLFYDYFKLKIIKILLEQINYNYFSINFAIDFSNKLKDYKEKINELDKEILKYIAKIENMKEENENIKNEKNILLSHLKKCQKGIEVRNFIIDFNLKGYSDELREEYSKKCEEFQINYFDYDIKFDSPEYLQLQQMYKFLQLTNRGAAPTTIKDEVYKYVDMYKNCINGKYHGKQTYLEDLDKEDNVDIDEDEKAFKNLGEQEQKIIELIYNTKDAIEKKLDSLISENKKQFLIRIIKEISRNGTDLQKVWGYYDKNDVENLENYVKSFYQNNKIIRTIKDFEQKIIDDTVLSRINSIIA